jgi:dTDP-4-amino-4,6-dideoxygalactose transaminase
LKYLDDDNAYRRQLAAWYDAGLAGAPAIERVPVGPDCRPSRHLYQVLVARRDDVMVALNREQIYPGVHYRDNSLYPMYADQPPCPRARTASERVISLPMHLQMDEADVKRVCDVLKAVTT